MIPMLSPTTAFAETNEAQPEVSARGTKVEDVAGGSWRASQVIGTNVKNAGDETIGEVEDLVVDMKSGEILAVVISSGGFLNIADTFSSVPVTHLRYDKEAKGFKTKLTKEQLQGAPRFQKSAWPNYDDSKITDDLRRYRDSLGRDATPGDTQSRGTRPDNSAQNKDRMGKDVSNPTDQGGSEQDVLTTAKIRKAIVDADLSFNTKNIKIVTKGGHVTLMGVVKNHNEHEAVLKIVQSHADKESITDNLKVDHQ